MPIKLQTRNSFINIILIHFKTLFAHEKRYSLFNIYRNCNNSY